MSVTVPYLAEGACNLIEDFISANLPAALDVVAARYSDGIKLDNIKEFLIFKKAQNLQNPSIYLIADDYDFKVDSNKSNFVNAEASFPISCIVEDVNEDRLTRKAYRYQAALHSVLNLANMKTQDNVLSLKVVVKNCAFSDMWKRADGSGEGGKFLKEFVLKCTVFHTESF